MSTELDDRIRSLMNRIADAAPLPPGFDDLDAADARLESSPPRRRIVVWTGLAAASLALVAALQVGRSSSGSTVPGDDVDTTSAPTAPTASIPVPTTPQPSTYEPSSSTTSAPWKGLPTLPDELALVPLPAATSIDLMSADGTPMRITRGESFCVLFRPDGGGGCSQLTGDGPRQWAGGGRIVGATDGPTERLEYWLLNEGVSVVLYEASGATACTAPPESVPAYPGVRLWTCVVRNDAVAPYRAVFTANSASYVYGLGPLP